MNLATLHKVAYFLHKIKLRPLAQLVYYIQFLIYNSAVPPSCKIGKGSFFAYGGIGVVIHKNTVIGKNCIIGQGITIGGKSKIKDVPVIGNSVFIGAGCRILGNIKIGDNVVIGPNSVVLKDVPSNSAIAGIPAKIIKSGIMMKDLV